MEGLIRTFLAALCLVFICLVLVCLAAPAAARAPHASSTCSWADPGADPFRGDLQQAVMSYAEIPVTTRMLLAWRLRWRPADDRVEISATGVTGSPAVDYGDIVGMHWGKGRRCDTVDRSAWRPGHTEPASVYRQGNFCLVMPDICRNVSWTTCRPSALAALPVNQVHAMAVPEPGSAWMVLPALAVVWLGRWRAARRRASRVVG